MDLICDYREHSALKILRNTVNKNNKYSSINIKRENITLGDFAFGNVIVERKTHADLASSILDGRYREQCFRLSEYSRNNPSVKVVYIIEGNFDLFFASHNIDKDKLYSAIVSLLYEKGFSVLLTKHLNETCELLLKFTHKYYTKYSKASAPHYSSNASEEIDVCACSASSDANDNAGTVNAPEEHMGNVENLVRQAQAMRKKEQITAHNIGVIMLCNVPHVSVHIAKELLRPFNYDVYDFMKVVKNDRNFLFNLRIAGNNGKERKLSKNIASTLYALFAESDNLGANETACPISNLTSDLDPQGPES